MSQPKEIGQYQIVEALLTAGKVQFYRAIDPTSQRHIVLKTAPKDSADAEVIGAISRFKAQAEVSSGLKHPGIIEVYGYNEDSGLAFVALEFVEGCALRSRLRVPIADATSLMVQLLKALEYAHSNGVLHLNLSPSALVLTSQGHLKLAEFGGPRTGTGDSAYRSPEQIAGAEVDQRSDVFSAGALFYELLTASSPFPGPPDKLREQICRGQDTPASVAKPGVPTAFDQLCAKSLATAPHHRYPTVKSFCDDVCAVYVGVFGALPKERVSNETAVSAFLSSLRTEPKRSRSKPPIPKSQPKVAPVPPVSSFATEVLRKVERELAPFLGPLARIVVKEAASKATDLNMLYDLSADSLASPDDRKGFLAKRPGGSAPDAHEKPVNDSAETATYPDIVLSASLARQPEDAAIREPERVVKPPEKDVLRVESRVASVPLPTPREVASNPIPEPITQKAMTNGDLKIATESEGSKKVAPEIDMAARLEGILGKQPETLAGYVTDNPPPLDRVIHPFIASAEALARLYALQRKTGGLVPQNILFDPVGKASIRTVSTTVMRGTMLVGAVGSPRYAAPESLADNHLGEESAPGKADIYALGFIFYEILLGRKNFHSVFPQKTDLEWLRWQADTSKKAPSLKSQLPDHPTAVSELLESMMEKDTTRRTNDLASILLRLKSIAQQASRTVVVLAVESESETAPASLDPTPKTKERGGRWIALIILAVVFLLAILGLFLWRNPELRRKVIPFHHRSGVGTKDIQQPIQVLWLG